MAAVEFKIDFTEFEKAINRAYNMGEIRRRDIADVFRKADRPLVSAIKRNAPISKKGMISKKHPARSHVRGVLRKKVKFMVSKRKKFVYIVGSSAWYSKIVMYGHGSFQGNQFIDRAINQTEAQVSNDIKNGLMKLTQKEWQNG